MKYKAIFFDRDGTLTDFNKKKEIWRIRKSANGAANLLSCHMKK